MRKGGRAIFHEYGHYTTWRFFPQRTSLVEFRAHVIATWRESGGDPDTGLQFAIVVNEERICGALGCARIFLSSAKRLHVAVAVAIHSCPSFAIAGTRPRRQRVCRQSPGRPRRGEREEASFMLTPLVLEIVAEKV